LYNRNPKIWCTNATSIEVAFFFFGRPMARDRDIWESTEWQSRRLKYQQYEQWFDGTKLDGTMPTRDRETGEKVRKFPLDINLVELACTVHRDLVRGMPDQDDPLFVQSVVDRGTENAEALENLINEGVWRPSHGGPLQQEALLSMMIYGGTVLKVSWEPWEIELPYGTAIRLIKNPGHIMPRADWLNPWKLLECYVGYEISAEDAMAKYGIEVASPTALYMEHWTDSEYRITVNDRVVKMKIGDDAWTLAGENPLGFVPIFYIPHERTTKELWGDSLVEGQTELVEEVNARTADLADVVRKSLPGVLLGTDITRNPSMRKVTADGQVVLRIVDLGNSRAMQGGSVKPEAKEMPTPDLPEELSRFPKTLLDFWMMVSRISPAVFGLDDTSSGRITGPAIAQRMWTSIAHAVTARSNFADAKTSADKAALRLIVSKRDSVEFPVPEITPRQIMTTKIMQRWPEMIPLDQEVRHREMIERLGQFGISIEGYLKAMGIEDVEGERQRILDWMKEQMDTEAEAKAKAVPPGGVNAGNQTGNQAQKQRPATS